MRDEDIKDIEANNNDGENIKKLKKRLLIVGIIVASLFAAKIIFKQDTSKAKHEYYDKDIKIVSNHNLGSDDDKDVSTNIFVSKSVPQITDNTKAISKLEKELQDEKAKREALEKKLTDEKRNDGNNNSPYGNPFWKKSITDSHEVNVINDNSEREEKVKPEPKVETFQMWKKEPTPLIKKNDELIKSDVNTSKATPDKKKDDEEDDSDVVTVIPSGSIALVYLEHGFLAGTLNSGTNSLQPTQATIVSEFFLPMGKTFDFRGSVASLEAKGSLSSHRASLKLIRLSGYSDGEMIDIPFEGYATDISSGIGGLAGNVVSKQNELFMASLFAFTAQGLADSSVASTQTISNTGTGAVITQDPTKTFRNSLLGGAGKGAESVGKQIMNIAEQVEAVIEVLGGQYMIIHITQPFKLRKKVIYSNKRVKEVTKNTSSSGVVKNSQEVNIAKQINQIAGE